MSGLIYLVRNLANNKTYVGQTKIGTKKRLRDHWRDAKRGSTTYFHRAMRKHGRENFSIEVIEECSIDLLAEREIHFISLMKPDYNLTKGGQGGNGWPKIIPGTRMWITNGTIQKRVPLTTEIPEGFWRGMSDAAKNANSKALLGRTFTDDHKANISKGQTGRTVSDSTRAKISEAQVGKPRLHQKRTSRKHVQLTQSLE